ncbi:hypothetical protein [Aeromicrobium alkaliterrae]|uniref:Exo-alpha-sialidase n=1 Tax=Aeromicrobium alkaliterrae TaxID=302168 RepID=A0ABP4VGW9_9ACTN
MTTQRTWRLLALFLLVDAVLVVIMLRHVSGDGSSTSPTTAPTTVATDEPTEAPAPAAALPGLIDVADGLVVWGPRGSCADGVPITLGRSTGDSRAELDPGVTELLRVDVNADGDVYVIGADAECAPVERLLAAGEAEWVDPPGGIRRWHLTPSQPTLTTPAGARDPGCAPVGFTSDGAAGVVACADGTVRTSGDDGATWETLATVSGLTGVTQTDDGVVVLASAAECPLAAERIEGGAPVVLGCISEVPTQGLALIGSGGGSYAAVVGDAVVISGEPIGQGPSVSG